MHEIDAIRKTPHSTHVSLALSPVTPPFKVPRSFQVKKDTVSAERNLVQGICICLYCVQFRDDDDLGHRFTAPTPNKQNTKALNSRAADNTGDDGHWSLVALNALEPTTAYASGRIELVCLRLSTMALSSRFAFDEVYGVSQTFVVLAFGCPVG